MARVKCELSMVKLAGTQLKWKIEFANQSQEVKKQELWNLCQFIK